MESEPATQLRLLGTKTARDARWSGLGPSDE